ncbi:MAG: peptidylprolyl isomerase [Fibrobacteres bacterium]|nr:peptidylprolyl isomerase [Fibrobacterota bacterium]
MQINRIAVAALCFSLLVVSTSFSFASKPPVDAIAVTKAGFITASELDTALNRYLKQIKRVSAGKEITDSEKVELTASTLNDLIYRKIFLAIAKKKKLTVLDSEVRERYDIVCTGLFDGDTSKFSKSLVDDGWTEDSYLANLKEIVLSEKARTIVMDGLDPSPEEVKEYYDSKQKEFTVGEIELAHILISAPQQDMPERGLKTVATVFRERGIPEDSLDAAVNKEVNARLSRLKAVRDSSLKGIDFAALAKNHSDDGSAEQGGALGFVPRGRTVKVFENAAFALKKNEISDIVTTEFGFHIIKALSDARERVQDFNEVEFTISSRLRAEKEAAKLKQLENAWKVQRIETGRK